jgi:hypothetical protein
MKVQCVEKEITGFLKTLKIEHEDKTYNAELEYDQHSGYELRFYDESGEWIEMPEWAEDFDNGESLECALDTASGMWEYCPAIPSEAKVAV